MSNRINLGELQKLQPATRPMQNPVEGDVRKLPDGSSIAHDELEILAAISVLGSAAKIAGQWVGVCMKAVAASLGDPIAANPMVHEAAWPRIYSSSPVVQWFRQAQAAGLCTISEGYAYPTQELADLLLAQAAG